jgi:hypothetical protein
MGANLSPDLAAEMMAAMRLSPALFRIHRWLAWLVGLQVLAWMLSGLLFAWLPFQPWVKGHEVAHAPKLVLPPDWAARSSQALAAMGAEAAPEQLQAVMTAQGPALKLGPARWLRLDGQPWREPQADEVAAFARQLYRGEGAFQGVQRLAEVPAQLGIVKELAGRRDVWQVRFDDGLHTRLYFHGASGEYLTVRTRAWVWFDFFWRLHILDIADGEDFNGTLLRVATLAFFGLTVAGLLLSLLAIRRATRRMAR